MSELTSAAMTARKYGYRVQVSNEALGAIEPPPPPTPEEAKARRLRQAARLGYEQRLAEHLELTNHPVGVLHRRVDRGYGWPVCLGCDGATEESPEWPCRTAVAFGRSVGIDPPEGEYE